MTKFNYIRNKIKKKIPCDLSFMPCLRKDHAVRGAFQIIIHYSAPITGHPRINKNTYSSCQTHTTHVFITQIVLLKWYSKPITQAIGKNNGSSTIAQETSLTGDLVSITRGYGSNWFDATFSAGTNKDWTALLLPVLLVARATAEHEVLSSKTRLVKVFLGFSSGTHTTSLPSSLSTSLSA